MGELRVIQVQCASAASAKKRTCCLCYPVPTPARTTVGCLFVVKLGFGGVQSGIGVPPSWHLRVWLELAVLRSGGECEELVMPYGATAAIGGRDHAPERAGGIPGGVDSGIDRHPLGLIEVG
jgi:hypothetical protein